MWIATDDRRILLYVAADPENGSEVGRIMLPAAPLCQVPPPSSLLSQVVHHQVKMFTMQLTMFVLGNQSSYCKRHTYRCTTVARSSSVW